MGESGGSFLGQSPSEEQFHHATGGWPYGARR